VINSIPLENNSYRIRIILVGSRISLFPLRKTEENGIDILLKDFTSRRRAKPCKLFPSTWKVSLVTNGFYSGKRYLLAIDGIKSIITG
jgi:hypothetical protein